MPINKRQHLINVILNKIWMLYTNISWNYSEHLNISPSFNIYISSLTHNYITGKDSPDTQSSKFFHINFGTEFELN